RRLAEAGQIDGDAAVALLQRIDLVVPHGRLQREGVEEDDGLALPAVDDVDGLTIDFEQRHGRAPWKRAGGTPHLYPMTSVSGESTGEQKPSTRWLYQPESSRRRYDSRSRPRSATCASASCTSAEVGSARRRTVHRPRLSTSQPANPA